MAEHTAENDAPRVLTELELTEAVAEWLCTRYEDDEGFGCEPEAGPPCIGHVMEASAILAGDGGRQAAWQEGYAAAETMARCYGHTDHWEDEPDNPYRITPPGSGNADG